MEPLKIIYIASYPRSGSTILGNVLNEVEGVFFAGEVSYLWRRNLLGGRRCGCGRSITDCDLWSDILSRFQAKSPGPAEISEIARWQDESMRSRHLVSILRRRQPRARQDYLEALGAMYEAIADATGARVIVDSSKWPADAAALELMPGIDASIVHLVRDPRGVVFSRQRSKAPKDAEGRVRCRPALLAYDSAGWTATNLALEVTCRSARASTRLLYEDFVEHPRASLDAIGDLVGDDGVRWPFAEDHRFELGTNHTAGGNRNRFRVGEIRLRDERTWTREMRRRDQVMTSTLTLPLLHRYGYRRALGGPAAQR